MAKVSSEPLVSRAAISSKNSSSGHMSLFSMHVRGMKGFSFETRTRKSCQASNSKRLPKGTLQIIMSFAEPDKSQGKAQADLGMPMNHLPS